jgi:N-acetylmuramoyl-L-alanine amidase
VRHQTLHKIQRFLATISFISLLGIVMISWQRSGGDLPNLRQLVPAGTFGVLFNRQLTIISGHAGFDSGAVCLGADGQPTVTEQAINAAVAERLAARLRRGWAAVSIYEEFDPRLQDLESDLVVSLHADSCIAASGYKIAYTTRAEVLPATSRLDGCFTENYAAITGLAHHVDTITHDMTDYHAFRKLAPTTPALILEMGFLGGDQSLLTQQPDTVARGIVDSIRCFFQAANVQEND